MIDKKNFVTIHGWMISELMLQDKELLCYAIIYGFSQDNESCFTGSRKYISEWVGCSLPTVDKILNRLIDKNLIIKNSETKNGIIFNSYKVVDQEEQKQPVNFIGYKETLQGCKETLHNNNSNIDSNKNVKDKSFTKKDELFEQCWLKYGKRGSKKIAKGYWEKLTEKEKLLVLPHINAYVSTRDVQFQKHFERYLRDKIFTTVVFNHNTIVYDPTIQTEEGYNPVTGGNLNWNDYYNCYIYMGMFIDDIADGYNDDDRPDGASLMLNNGRGNIVWNKDKKQWVNT